MVTTGAITMSAIWDRTAEVLRGRGGMLAGIAAALLFLPAAVQNGLTAYGPRSAGLMALVGLVGLVVAVVTIWGNLALVAAASDPRTDRPAAIGIGARRLPVMLGLSILIAVAFVLLTLPAFAILKFSGVNVAAALAAGATPGTIPHGTAVGMVTYLMILGAFGIWASARLALLAPVVVNEQRGLGSIARSFDLTRGLTWRIIGVLLLFGVVVLVANAAAHAVVGLVARLLLGAAGRATANFLAALAGAAVIAGATVVSSVFLAQLYRVASGQEVARAFG